MKCVPCLAVLLSGRSKRQEVVELGECSIFDDVLVKLLTYVLKAVSAMSGSTDPAGNGNPCSISWILMSNKKWD